MALVEGCKHSLEISIPVIDVESESGRVTADIQKRAKLPGFRPGKAPTGIIRKQFAGDIRQQVLENLVPKFLQKQFEAENLNVVGQPDIKDIHFHDGEPLRFKAEFEVVPEIELGDYRGVEVPYAEPQVSDEDIRAFCRGNIAHFKIPRYIKFVDGFPTTATGKVQKYLLRERIAAELTSDSDRTT